MTMLLSFMPVIARAATSGECGANLTWTLDDEGTLTISGEGAMSYWRSYSDVPWYSSRSSIKDVIIGNNVESIGDYAFFHCSSLTSVTIPDSVESIGDDAFSYCSSLESVTIGNSVESIGYSVFFYCSSLTSISVDINNQSYSSENGNLFNKDKTAIIQYAIGKTDTQYTIPSSVTSIGKYAFSVCSSLESVTIGNSVEIIGNYAFFYCSSLTSVTIPNSVESIGDAAFYECNSLTDVYYGGNEEQWQAISIGTSNTPLTNAKIHYNSSGAKPALPETLTMPSDINNVTINHKGTAYGYFPVTNVDGAALKNKSVSYTIDGGAQKTAVTDEYGYLCVQIPNITQSHDYAVSISGSGVVPSTGTLSVTVKPLYFTSTYEGTMTKGVSVGVGIGVGGSIGNLKAEAEAAEIGASGSNKKGFSWSQECKDGKTKLTVTANQNSEAAVKAKVGLWAGASASNAHAEVSVGDIHGSAKYGAISSVGFEDEDFDANDKADVTRLAKFMTCAFLENMDSNVATQYLLEKLNFTPDTYEDGSTVAVSGGASVGSVTLKNGDTEFASVTLGGIDGNAVWSQSVKTAKDKSVNRKSSVSADAGVKLGDVSFFKKDGSNKLSTGVSTFTKSFINNKIQFAATNDKDGNLTSLGIVLTDNDSSSILWSRKTTSTQRSLTYSDDAAKQVASSYNELQNFSNGNKGFFTPFQMIKATDAIMKSNKKGEFSENITKSQGLDLNASASAKMFLKLGGQLGVSGAESYSYETENGIYENNVAYIQAKNDVESTVEDDFIKISDAFDISSKYMDDMIAEWWDTISGWIDDAADAVIDAGKAALEKTKDVVTGWKVSITKAVEDISPFSVLAVDSEVSLFSTSSVATTVGSPYIVSVEDENGNEVTDLSSNPLLLTLEYTDDELAGAGVTDINDVAIYRWDEDKCVYVRMGGTLNEANKSLSLEITKPGQYILAADNCPPAVTEFKASHGGISPDITAIVSDMSGIADFEMTIDGEAVIDNSNLDDYYDHTTAELVYPTSGLAAGTHTAVIYASDTSGNALTDGVSLEFTVNTDAPVISNVTELSEHVKDSVDVSAEVTGESISAVYLNIEETDEDGRNTRSTYEMTGENGVYTASASDITDGAAIKVWVSAYSADGNGAQSEKQEVLYVLSKPELSVSNDGNSTVTVTATNCDNITDGTIILAVYNSDETLKNVYMQDFAQTVTFDNLDLNGGTIKAMLWDSVDTMRPLAKAGEMIIE